MFDPSLERKKTIKFTSKSTLLGIGEIMVEKNEGRRIVLKDSNYANDLIIKRFSKKPAFTDHELK